MFGGTGIINILTNFGIGAQTLSYNYVTHLLLPHLLHKVQGQF